MTKGELIEENAMDIPFPDRPKEHTSTERLEIEKLQERVAELETALRFIAEGKFIFGNTPSEAVQSAIYKARAALKRKDDE